MVFSFFSFDLKHLLSLFFPLLEVRSDARAAVARLFVNEWWFGFSFMFCFTFSVVLPIRLLKQES